MVAGDPRSRPPDGPHGANVGRSAGVAPADRVLELRDGRLYSAQIDLEGTGTLAAIANHYTAGNVGSERRSEKDRALADVVHLRTVYDRLQQVLAEILFGLLALTAVT